MKIILGIIAVLISSISLAQEENIPQLKSESITVQKQLIPTNTRIKVVPALQVKLDNSRMSKVDLLVTRSIEPQNVKVTVAKTENRSIAEHINALEIKTQTVARQDKPLNITPSVTLTEQKE